jgi:F0F1-type ATP synthase membrane subunit b/b'
VDLSARIHQLEDMVRDAKSMPLSSSALLNRDEVLELIEQMKDSLPDEIKQARWIVKDREELLAKARRDAESMVDQAREEQLRLASHEAVVQRADEEGARILQEAQDDARRLRLEAEDYVDAKLAQLENALQRILEDIVASNQSLGRTIDQVQAGREKLRGSVPATNVSLGADAQLPEMLEMRHQAQLREDGEA